MKYGPRFHATLAICAIGFSCIATAYAQNTNGVQNSRPAAHVAVPPKSSPVQNPLEPPASAENAASVNRNPNLVPGHSGQTGAQGESYGTFGIPYTSTRVQHGDTNQSTITQNFLATTFPYRAVGQLTSSGGSCSASVIRRGIIVTAAHCIVRFGRSNNNTGYLFTPAFFAPGATSSDRAPYGVWDWEWLEWPATWSNGKDTGSGSARNNDIAVIAIRKLGGQHIGDVVGQLNYAWNNYSFVKSPKTGNLDVAAVTTLGFPGQMDAGGRLQRADGPSYLTTVSNALQIWQGNNFTGGASGGPWIVNFVSRRPAFSGGATAGTQANDNIVIGVTSWGTADPNRPKDNYSSQFAQNKEYPSASYGSYGAGNIAALLKNICGRKLNNVTLASLGYCD